MRAGFRDSKQLINLVNQLKFNPTDIASIAFISDEIKVPIFTYDASGQWQTKEILDHNRKFINIYYDVVMDHMSTLEIDKDIVIELADFTKGDIVTNYMDIIQESVSRTGKYKDQHELILQLSHYVSSFSISIRLGLYKTETPELYTPKLISVLKLEARNKFNRHLSRILELDTIQLNSI